MKQVKIYHCRFHRLQSDRNKKLRIHEWKMSQDGTLNLYAEI